jgi:hypothetical protein
MAMATTSMLVRHPLGHLLTMSHTEVVVAMTGYALQVELPHGLSLLQASSSDVVPHCISKNEASLVDESSRPWETFADFVCDTAPIYCIPSSSTD